MAKMADITVKKADGTTNAIYSQFSPSAGDSVAAIWRNNGVGSKVNQRPEFRLVASSPSQGKRTTKMTFVYPLLATVGGVEQITDYVTVVTTVKISENATTADIAEGVIQGLNLVASSLAASAAKDGVAPT